VREVVGRVGWGREHIWGIGLDQEAVVRDELEGCPLGGLARVEEVATEREIRAEVCKRGQQISGAGVGMEEEATCGEVRGAEEIEEGSEGLEAVYGERAIELCGEGDLWAEGIDLCRQVVALDPAVEADLANAGSRVGVEEGFEAGAPALWRGWCEPPGVEAKGGDDGIGVEVCELGDGGPIGGRGAVHQDLGHIEEVEGGDDGGGIAEAWVLQVEVGIEEHGTKPAIGGRRTVVLRIAMRGWEGKGLGWATRGWWHWRHRGREDVASLRAGTGWGFDRGAGRVEVGGRGNGKGRAAVDRCDYG
jgi:hypothetical protein